MGIDDIVKGVTDVVKMGADKLWMDKDKKEQILFDKEKFIQETTFAIKKLAQDGELKKVDALFREDQAQRDHVNKQFGTVDQLKDFFLGKIILIGRASIRWIITGYAMYQTHKIVNWVFTQEMLNALIAGTIKGAALWLVTLIACAVIGIPLFYVTGITVEKLLKSRGVI
jgi:hypothetical protein